MVESLMGHYYRPDDPPELTTFVAADWIAALRTRPIEAVAEARRRWVTSQRRRPTLAEFLTFVATVEGEQGARMRPPHLLPARSAPFAELTDPERWSWYARMRVWRRRMGLDGTDPFGGVCRDEDLEREAEAELPADPGPRPRCPTQAEREAAEYRDAWARERGFEGFAAMKTGGPAPRRMAAE